MSGWPGSDHHQPCPCGLDLADECPRCNSINPLGSMRIEPAIGSARREPTYGMCTACGSVEVALDRVTGHRDLSGMGESPRYPTGYGCEVCS